MGKIKYIVEDGQLVPLCAIDKDGNYINCLTGNELHKGNLKSMLKKIKYHEQELDFKIYKITEKVTPYMFKNLTIDKEPYAILPGRVLGYIYIINGQMNFLDDNKRLVNKYTREYMQDKILNEEYSTILIWGGNDEY